LLKQRQGLHPSIGVILDFGQRRIYDALPGPGDKKIGDEVLGRHVLAVDIWRFAIENLSWHWFI
jgi:hypothetical protein